MIASPAELESREMLSLILPLSFLFKTTGDLCLLFFIFQIPFPKPQVIYLKPANWGKKPLFEIEFSALYYLIFF